MKIINSTNQDITEIFKLYKLATDFQKEKYPENQWPEFDEKSIQTEISQNRQFKLLINDQIACIWAITYNDPQIWEDNDNDYSIYIHRIATNPDFRGKNFVKKIVEWAKIFANKQNKQFIRMDTCGKNDKLINHYSKCGFKFLEMRKLKNSSELPSHYHNAYVCYFEIKL